MYEGMGRLRLFRKRKDSFNVIMNSELKIKHTARKGPNCHLIV